MCGILGVVTVLSVQIYLVHSTTYNLCVHQCSATTCNCNQSYIYKNTTKYTLFGSQLFDAKRECTLFTNQQLSTSLYCEYFCPNDTYLCVAPGQVHPPKYEVHVREHWWYPNAGDNDNSDLNNSLCTGNIKWCNFRDSFDGIVKKMILDVDTNNYVDQSQVSSCTANRDPNFRIMCGRCLPGYYETKCDDGKSNEWIIPVGMMLCFGLVFWLFRIKWKTDETRLLLQNIAVFLPNLNLFNLSIFG
eukprot:24456_1